MKRFPSAKKIISLALALTTTIPLSMTVCQAIPVKAASRAVNVYTRQKPISLVVFSRTANYTGTQGGWFGKILKDKF